MGTKLFLVAFGIILILLVVSVAKLLTYNNENLRLSTHLRIKRSELASAEAVRKALSRKLGKQICKYADAGRGNRDPAAAKGKPIRNNPKPETVSQQKGPLSSLQSTDPKKKSSIEREIDRLLVAIIDYNRRIGDFISEQHRRRLDWWRPDAPNALSHDEFCKILIERTIRFLHLSGEKKGRFQGGHWGPL
jgi:hypothetical protein